MLSAQGYISANKKIRRTARRCNNQKKQMPVSTFGITANDFLKQRFLPVTDISLPSLNVCNEIETTFFQSLRYLCDLHKFQSIDADIEPFPYNICIAFEKVREQLDKRNSDLELFIISIRNLPVVCTGKILETGSRLYYIPLYLLEKMQQSGKRRLFYLLLSAFAYFHKAGVSLCDRGTFIGYQMEIIKEYIGEASADWEKAEYEEIKETTNNITTQCNCICKMIASPYNLQQFGLRLQQIKPENCKEEIVVQAINEVYQLYQSFPQKKFSGQLYDRFISPEIEDRIYIEQYLSFFWGAETWFDEQVSETINAHLQDITTADEPVALQIFDKPQLAVSHDLEFESRFLQCITQLNSALYAL